MKWLVLLLLIAGAAPASERLEFDGKWRLDTTGVGSYAISFSVPPLAGKSVRLVLDPAFDGADVRLNGQVFSVHDALETDIADRLRHDQLNLLHVSLQTARPGLIPSAHLLIGPRVFISNRRVLVTPASNGAQIAVSIWITNVTENTVVTDIDCNASPGGGGSTTGVTVSPGTTRSVELRWTITPDKVRLWDQGDPHLYQLMTSIAAVSDSGDLQYHDSDVVTFGIRRVESRRGSFFLNGNAVQSKGSKLSWVASDRVAAGLLAATDADGGAVIESSTGDRTMLRTMIERDWNHPSILGWRIRTEADVAFVRALDSSRPVLVFDLAPKDR